jgi:hypothetical protein
MGAEFIRRAAKTFVKRWDQGRKMLGTADLFTNEPDCAATSAPFDLAQNADLHAGETVTVEKEGEALVARHGLSEVARLVHPPSHLLQALDRSCGIAKGTVENVHVVARVAEISLC